MKNNALYKYVAVIGLDGMGNFNAKTETPRMDEIFSGGSVTYSALSMDPTISAQNWGGMLLGAAPAVHGLTNGIISNYEYKNKELPSLFTRIRREYPEAYLSSCCNWDPINYGIVEHDAGVSLFTADNDADLTPVICSEVAKKPTFLFVQFDDIDGAGHHSTYGSDDHLKKITETDALVGRVYDAYKKAGILDDTLFLVIADHGGIRNGHGGYTDSEKYVFFGAGGREVPKCEIGYAVTKDIAATVLYALGIDIPEYDKHGFSSQVPSGIFDGVGNNYYIPEAKNYYIPPKATPDFNGKDGLKNVFAENKIKLALFMDDDVNDAAGNCTPEIKGNVKFYSDGVNGSYGEFGKTGHAVYDGVKIGSGSFSIALWIKIDRSLTEAPALCGNKDWWWQNRRGKGIVLSLRCADTVFNAGNGNDDFDFETAFPDDVADGWIHTIISMDKEKREVRCYYNFNLCHTMPIEDNFLGDLDSMPFTVGDDGLGRYNCETHDFLVHMDDFLLLDGCISDSEIKKLAGYYGVSEE